MIGSAFSGRNGASEPWSVSDITSYIQELFDLDYRLRDIEVQGEVSNFRRARSGHLYFTLKDERAQLNCVMWRSAAMRTAHDPDDGDAIVARGRISVYEKQGVYQLYVERITAVGRGDLALAFEELKRRLEEEGLFATEHKRSIPMFPRKIGVVTSADAAALRDILNVLKRRYPLASLLIAPTLVQGAEAPPQIVRALQWLDGRNDVDVIIIARGGGSIEDLWAFNDEGVAHAIFNARHTIVSGVGHETDFTIADFVADVRAPTPSAAAELCVPNADDLYAHIAGFEKRLAASMERSLVDDDARVGALVRNLRHLGPLTRISNAMQNVDRLWERLDSALWRRLDHVRTRLQLASTRLDAVGPQATLTRGYAVVRHPDGGIVRRTGQVAAGNRLQVRVSDGQFDVVVEDLEPEAQDG